MPSEPSNALTAPTANDPPAPEPPAKPPLIGQGLALEAVSQAAAMAVQDAGTYFRQIAAVSAAAVAVFTAKMVEEKKADPWVGLIKDVGDSVTAASTVLKTVGADAAAVVKSFTS
jgi:hypothetical protein